MYYKKLPIRCVAFDVDGVLFSSSRIIADAYARASAIYSQKNSKTIPYHTAKRITHEIGKPVSEIFYNLFPGLNILERQELAVLASKILIEMVLAKKGNLLSNVKNIFSYLRYQKIYIVLASNGRRPYIQAILDAYYLKDFVNTLCCIGDTMHQVTFDSKASLLRFYMRRYLLHPKEILMVGDRYTDYEAALTTHVPFVGVLSGHGTELHSKQLTYKIRDLIELKKVIG